MNKPVLNADGTLSLPAMTLATAQVDELLHDLALARNQMQPEVPQDLHELEYVVSQHNPHVTVERLEGGLIRMGIRHRGMGWCVFTFDMHTAATVRNFLDKRVHGAGGLDDTSSRGDRSH